MTSSQKIRILRIQNVQKCKANNEKKRINQTTSFGILLFYKQSFIMADLEATMRPRLKVKLFFPLSKQKKSTINHRNHQIMAQFFVSSSLSSLYPGRSFCTTEVQSRAEQSWAKFSMATSSVCFFDSLNFPCLFFFDNWKIIQSKTLQC